MKAKSILIVDDDEAILELMRLVLESEGYRITLSSDGRLFEKALIEMPDLIFLDIHLSGADGTLLCQRLKESREPRNPPIILVSAAAETARLAEEVGADGYLLKPFDLADLISLAKKYLPLEK